MMSHKARIGICISPIEAFWVEVHEAIYRRIADYSLEALPFSGYDYPLNPTEDEQNALLEEIFSQELDALIGWDYPESMALAVLDAGIPIVHLYETNIKHPLSVSPLGLEKAAEDLTAYLLQCLPNEAHILAIGGMLQTDRPDDGISRVKGIKKIIAQHPGYSFRHLPSHWDPARARSEILAGLTVLGADVDAIIGLSDTLALIGREVALKLDRDIPVVGINGDPAAIAAIIKGDMIATMETSATELGEQAVDIAMNIVNGQSVTAHFDMKARLVTAKNATERAIEKLISISHFPTLLADSKHREQGEHLTHLETSLHISHQIGTILDRERLPIELAKLIRANYGYDDVQLALWSDATQLLSIMDTEAGRQLRAHTLLDSGILGEAVSRNELIFIPDLQNSFRFEPDPGWPHTRTRIVVPIRHGTVVSGLLDLHAFRVMYCTQQHLLGLQSVADQVGVALQNLKLYEEALQAKVIAEKAEQLKMRLMANIGHELRTPLQIITGYVEQLQGSRATTEAAEQIEHNAQHLLRLINDLLDLSRAEINELRIVPSLLDPHDLLTETFHSMASSETRSTIEWRLELAEHLPLIQVDPDRFRQILLNLLSNAKKFTPSGAITLGAAVQARQLHIWVQDTGSGILLEQQERIFEPFITGDNQARRNEGIGLGLSITRRLVALHGGGLTVESQPGQGSIFHVYVPLPNLKDAAPSILGAQASSSSLFLISHHDAQPQTARYCERESLSIRCVYNMESLAQALTEGLPRVLAWDADETSADIQQVLQYLYEHPILGEVPFLLFDSARQLGDTTILLKPMRANNLLSFITATQFSQNEGPILIVDDDVHAQQYYASVIGDYLPRYKVQIAANGTQAVACMCETVPSLVVLDLMMPEMDGFEVIQWMRAQPMVLHVPVVILSGKLLTFEDIKRLKPYRKISFQTKRILEEDELGSIFQHAVVSEISPSSDTSTIANQAVAFIQNHYDENIARQDIADAVGVSENYLTQVFHNEMGIALWEYLNRYRITKSKDLLTRTHMTVAQVATRVGFEDPAYFSRVFRRHTGQSPRAYRKST